MKHAIIHCFSGTGNSAHAARVIRGALEESGVPAEYHAVRRDAVAPAAPADLHVFVFPVYALAVPHLMARHIRRLAPGAGARTAVVCTIGRLSAVERDGYEGGALMQARSLLARRGYDVFLTDVIDYPASITNAVPPPTPANAEKILRESAVLAGQVAGRIARGEPGIRPCGALSRAGSRLFGLLYSLVGRFMFGKLYVADERCDACGICERACPSGALRLWGGRAFWRWRCEGCERCINACPRRAVQLSAFRLALFTVPLFWNPLASLGNALVPVHGWVLSALIHVIAYALAVVILDLLAALLERVPGLRRLLSLSWTRRFRRYTAPGFTFRD